MGHRPLAVGERRVGPDGHMPLDGRTFWWYGGPGADSRVRPVDLVTEELGEPGLPEFLDPSLLGEHEQWLIKHSSLAPVTPGTATSPLGTDGTRLGFRAAWDRDTGEVRYHRIDGVQETVPSTHRDVAPWGLNPRCGRPSGPCCPTSAIRCSWPESWASSSRPPARSRTGTGS